VSRRGGCVGVQLGRNGYEIGLDQMTASCGVTRVNAQLPQSNVLDQALPTTLSLPRRDLLAGLVILGCVNGLAAKVIDEVYQHGWVDSLFGTTNISVIVWASCFAGVSLISRDRSGEANLVDFAVGAAFLLLVVLPIGSLNWLALAGLCIYIIVSSDCVSTRQGAVVLLATTIPMLWTPFLLRVFGSWILALDASLVGRILGTHRAGNVVEFADSSGELVVLPPCSSLANVSLAMLCWVTISRSVDHKSRPYDVLWCAAACGCIVAVNVIRMAMMAQSESLYDSIHSESSNAITSAIMLTLIISICLLGVRRELFARV